MNLLLWILFGMIVGFAANFLDTKPSGVGLIGTMILGILGTFVGGFIGNLLFGVATSGYNLSSFMIAIGGAIIILLIGRVFQHENIL